MSRAAILVALVMGASTLGCLYDPDQRCGPSMIYVAAARACVCEPSAVAVAGGCQPCAADEVVSAGKCACAAGQTKNASNVCVVVPGLGDSCDTATAPCTDAIYSYCATTSGTAGTCTKSCTSNSDCDGAYTCATWEPQPYCRRFEGLGASCSSPADCTGDAAFCDSVMTHTCIVAGCSLTENDCPRDTQCCDFSQFGIGTLCAAECP